MPGTRPRHFLHNSDLCCLIQQDCYLAQAQARWALRTAHEQALNLSQKMGWVNWLRKNVKSVPISPAGR